EQKRWAMPFWVDVFATQLDEDFVDAGRGGEDEDKIFTGIYGHLDWQKGHVAEPYILYRRSKGTTTSPDGILASLRASGRTNEERTTLGIHVHGKLASIPGLQYAGEFAAQFGTINGDGVRNLNIEDAYGGYAQVSYTKENWNWKPQIGYAFHFASGDDDPTDGDIGTFDQIYPLAHAYLGYIDFQGWQNVISHQFSLSVKPIRNMLAKIDFHLFAQENEDDAWYGVGGAPNGGFSSAAINAVNADDEIGQEIDITLKYKLFDRLNVTAGYSHFFAGNLIDDVTGDDDGADWFYFMTSVKF
ncbi:MAG: alginate export family protein, partial [Candidatus Anammoxibacter sp.]